DAGVTCHPSLRIDSFQKELGVLADRLLILLERQVRLGERGEHPAVPAGQDLLVARRPHALRAHAVQLALAAGSDVGELLQGDTLVRGDALRIARNIENVVAFPVASLADFVKPAEDASLFFP